MSIIPVKQRSSVPDGEVLLPLDATRHVGLHFVSASMAAHHLKVDQDVGPPGAQI